MQELVAIQAAAEAHEVEEEYEIKAEALISGKTKKKETIFMVDELKGENSEDEFEGEDMDKDTEGTNES